MTTDDLDFASRLILRVAQQTRYLVPWTALPFASASLRVAEVLHHLTSQRVHDVYFPFVRFSVLHAVRVSIAWAAMTCGRRGQVSVLADLFGFLVIAWGGGTLVSLLLATPPAWLVSPVPWLVYVAIYVLAIPTRVASILTSAPALPLGLALSLVDGMTRGVAIASIPALTESTNSTKGSWLAPALLGAVATCGGGWIAQTLGLTQSEWTMGRPAALAGGFWSTMDVWGAIVAGIAYSALDGRYPALQGVRPLVAEALPEDLEINTGVARAVAVLILAGLFAARALYTALRPAVKVAEKRIQEKGASLPAKAAALNEKTRAKVQADIAAAGDVKAAGLDTPRTNRSSSRTSTPSAAGEGKVAGHETPRTTRASSRATTPGDSLEDTPSKARKRRSKRKVAAA